MKMSDALKIVRIRIYRRKCEYMCYALRRVLGETRTQLRIQRFIQERFGLAKYQAVDSYLRRNGVPEEDLTPENLREYRLRWLDSVIKEFQEKGD